MKTAGEVLIDNGLAFQAAKWYDQLIGAMEEYANLYSAGEEERLAYNAKHGITGLDHIFDSAGEDPLGEHASCSCGIPQPDADNECCMICGELLFPDDSLANVRLKKVEVNDGAMDVEIESEEIVRFFAGHMKELFDSVKGADNYYTVTMKFAGDAKAYTITFQRHPGKTPAEIYQTKIDELEKEIINLKSIK